MSKNHKQTRSFTYSAGVVARSFFMIVAVAIATIAILNRQWFYDEVNYLTFKPSSEVVSIEKELNLTSKGEFLFYASQPKIEAATAFNDDCNKTETTTSVLGCYTYDRIYVYNVTEEKLDGIKQVTAAHEMLHAAYARLSDSEKTRINKLLEAEYDKVKDDKNFKALAAYYNKTEPGELDNELHSLIATQVSDISSELEQYYSQYFTNRQAVVQMYKNYIEVFENLNDQASSLLSQINTLKNEIDSETAQYNTDVATFKSDVTDFNTRVSNSDFTSESEYSTQRAELLDRQSSLQSTRDAINEKIETYNSLIAQYNSIASQSQKLQNSINSSLSSTPSI